MRYMMKQKLFSWGDDFTIKNEAGEDISFDMVCHGDDKGSRS